MAAKGRCPLLDCNIPTADVLEIGCDARIADLQVRNSACFFGGELNLRVPISYAPAFGHDG